METIGVLVVYSHSDECSRCLSILVHSWVLAVSLWVLLPKVRVHSGSCMHPVLSRSVVGDSSPRRVVAQGDGWGWMRPERYSQCLRSPCPPQPTWVLLCKSSLAEDRISAIVCAHWSVADKMKLCLPDPNRD